MLNFWGESTDSTLGVVGVLKNGHSSWVEHSFKAAKNKANECIRENREHLS